MKKFLQQSHIFRQIIKFSVKLIVEREAIGFAAPRECKTFADPRECNKFRQIDGKIEELQKNFCQFSIFRETRVLLQQSFSSSYLVNSKAILLRDRRLGGIWFLLTLGSHISSLGASPLGMKISPACLQNPQPPARRSRNSIALEFTK